MLKILVWMLLLPLVFIGVTLWTIFEYALIVFDIPFIIWAILSGEDIEPSES